MNDKGEAIQADAHGNNVAILCSSCKHPVLLTSLVNQRGSDEAHPAKCNGCGEAYFLNVREETDKFYVYTI